MKKEHILLHTCCGPCFTGSIEQISNFKPIAYFYNPNIEPNSEYKKRFENAKTAANHYGIEIIKGEDDFEVWKEAIKGLEAEPEGGQRCRICFKIRLEKTKEFAERKGIQYFTTTLTVSPHKNFNVIKEIGKSITDSNIEYLPFDFKKHNGYLNSIKKSKELNLYRQNYCGCIFSIRK